MAANFIRVRLHFDYAPPAVLGCRMCWLLVDLRSCRVVADLESIIRDKFELSRGSIVSLFIEDCYLPHTESVLVVRDNDCVRVKVDSVSTTQTSPEASGENKRKRRRPAEDEGSVENSSSLEFKKKKRKRSVVESPAVNGPQTETEQTDTNATKKDKDKKRQKEEKTKTKTKSSPPPVKASPSVKKSAANTQKILTTTTTTTTKKPQSSSSSSTSSSEDEEPVRKIPAPKPVSKPAVNSTVAPSKTIQNGRPPSKKLPPPSSSSSSDTDSSSEEEDKTTKAKMTNDKSKLGEAATTTNNLIQNGGHESEEEIQLVIKKPVQHPHGRIVVGQTWQRGGRGRGKPEPREPWGKGRGRGANCIQYDYQENERGKKEASYSADSLTNVSVVLQNGPSLPKPDYSTMPLLAAPPQVGQKIAFKLLELTENYTPEVSDYKEGKILNFDPNTKQLELELLTSFQAPVEPGKFDLVYQNPDGSESVEYAVDRGSLVTERWDSLLEPRLVI